MKVKYSFYNELIPIEETDEYLLFNILTGGLNVLDAAVGQLLSRLSLEGGFSIVDHPAFMDELKDLHEKGFIVDAEIDEKERYHQNYIHNQSKKFKNSSHIGLTIGTTILCNMGCPYCFEVVKPNKSLTDPKIISGIVTYIESMIESAPVSKWGSLSVTWYGGEPLINKNAIQLLSDGLIALAEKYAIPYYGSIITNGLLLDKDTWQFLKKNKITSAQVTLDGAKEVHDKYRPLKSLNGRNYERILENLSLMPMGMNANIRINTDKRVAATLEKLLDDLQEYGLWPQRYKTVSLHLSWLRTGYIDPNNPAVAGLTEEEFFDVRHEFSCMQVRRFNKWTLGNNLPKAKIQWRMPEKQSDCATYVSPYFFTFDPEGGIHKCWETIHEKEQSSGSTVLKRWSAEDFDKYLKYSRTTVHPVCYNCKYNPVCEGLSCAQNSMIDINQDKFPCTAWKERLPEYFKKMYLLQKQGHEEVALLKHKEAALQTHANR